MAQGIAFTPEEEATKKAAMIEWLAESIRGTFSQAFAVVGISRGVGYNWLVADEQFKSDMNAARAKGNESGLDFAEGKIMELIGEKNIAAVIYFLKTQGRERGFIEKLAFDGANPLHTVNHDANRDYIFSKLLPEATTIDQAATPLPNDGQRAIAAPVSVEVVGATKPNGAGH